MSRPRRAALGFLVGAASASVGAWITGGRGAGLIVAGGLLMAWFLLLYDVDEEA